MPRQHADACRFGAPADLLRALAQMRGFLQQDRIVGTQARGQADTREIGHERQRNGLIHGHEVPPPGITPGCAGRVREGAKTQQGRSPSRDTAQR